MGRVLLGVAEHQSETGRGRRALGAFDDAGEVRVRDVGDEQRDGLGASGLESLCRRVGRVAEPVGDLDDVLPGMTVDPARSGEGAGDRRRGDARGRGHVGDRGSPTWTGSGTGRHGLILAKDGKRLPDPAALTSSDQLQRAKKQRYTERKDQSMSVAPEVERTPRKAALAAWIGSAWSTTTSRSTARQPPWSSRTSSSRKATTRQPRSVPSPPSGSPTSRGRWGRS